MKKQNWLVLLLGIPMACCAGMALGLVIIAWSTGLLGSPLKTGAPAPDFTLNTLAGHPIRLSGYQGQPVLISVGATW